MKADLKKVLIGHSASVYCLFVDKISSRLFSGSSDQMVGSWNLEQLIPDSFSVKLDAPIFSIEKVDQLLFLGQGSGGVHIIDLLTKKEVRHLKYHSLPIFKILAHPIKPYLYFLGGDGNLSIVDSTDFSLRWSLPISDDKLRAVALDAKKEKVLIGSSDGFIRILETEYYNVLGEKLAHEGGVYDMAWLTAEKLLTVGRDGHIRIWNYTGDQLFESESIPAHNFAIYSIDFSPSGKYFATGSRDKTIKIWNPDNLKKPLKISRQGPVGHTHSVNMVRWINDGLLVSAGDDRDLHFWTISDS
jgi:WD40 repeat protein